MVKNASRPRALALVAAALVAILVWSVAVGGPLTLNLTQLPGDPTDTDEINAPAPLVTDSTTADAVLVFRLSADFGCNPAKGRTQLFVTVSDTTRMVDFTRRTSPQTIEIKVPWVQMPWLDGREDCAARGAQAPTVKDAAGLPHYRLRSRANAFATLLCPGSGKSPPRVTATIPLDVWLRCPIEPLAPTQPATDLDAIKEHLSD